MLSSEVRIQAGAPRSITLAQLRPRDLELGHFSKTSSRRPWPPGGELRVPGLLDAVHCRRGLAGSLAFTASARLCSGHSPAVSRPLLREEEPVLVGQHSVLLCVALGGSRFPFGRRGSTTRPCIRRGFRARMLRRHRALAQALASRQRPGFSDWRGHGRFGCEGATFACPRPVEEDRNPACRASSTTVYLSPPDAVYCLRCTMMAMQRSVIERVN